MGAKYSSILSILVISIISVIIGYILGLNSCKYSIQNYTAQMEATSKNESLSNILTNLTNIYSEICFNFTLPRGLRGIAISCEEAVLLLISKNIEPRALVGFEGNSTEAYYIFTLKNGSRAKINVFTKEIKIISS